MKVILEYNTERNVWALVPALILITKDTRELILTWLYFDLVVILGRRKHRKNPYRCEKCGHNLAYKESPCVNCDLGSLDKNQPEEIKDL